MRLPVPAMLLPALLLAVAGCSTIKQNQGYIIDGPLLASVQPGVDNKDSVQKTLGRPTFAAEFDANEWYYISRNTRQIAFLQPKAQSQSITKISFVDKRPQTFWEAAGPGEYGFWANVNPEVSHPRWSQATEEVIGTGDRRATLLFNGYGEYVADLYKGLEKEKLYI